MILVGELEIPCVMAGSTTFRRRAKRGGVEGDQTYYLANLDRIRGKKKISLKVDPPPTWPSKWSLAMTRMMPSKFTGDSGCRRSGSATRTS